MACYTNLENYILDLIEKG